MGPASRAPWEAIWTTTSCSRVSTVCSRSKRCSSTSSLAWAGESADKPSTGSRLAKLLPFAPPPPKDPLPLWGSLGSCGDPLPLWGSLGSCGDPPARRARERRRRCAISSRSSRRSAASSRSSMPSDRLVHACCRASAASSSSSAAVLATAPPRAAPANRVQANRVHAPRAGGGCVKESSAIASRTAGSCSYRSRPKRRMSTPRSAVAAPAAPTGAPGRRPSQCGSREGAREVSRPRA